MPGMNPNEIRVAGTGRILTAPLGTALPPDVSTEWAADWTDLGYTTTDGIKFNKKDKIDPVDTWQSVSPARFVYSDRDLTVKFQLLQLNEDTLPFFFGGDAVAEGPAGSTVYRYELSAEPKKDERMLGVEFADGDVIKYRFIIRRGQVTETEELQLTRTAAVRLGVTFTALAVDNDTPLATWLIERPVVRRVRSLFKDREGVAPMPAFNVNAARAQRLEALGLTWDFEVDEETFSLPTEIPHRSAKALAELEDNDLDGLARSSRRGELQAAVRARGERPGHRGDP